MTRWATCSTKAVSSSVDIVMGAVPAWLVPGRSLGGWLPAETVVTVLDAEVEVRATPELVGAVGCVDMVLAGI